ncbi:hypothetical protein BO70DRAFT_393923 [Aspergillus heteromorphus CBS 117.55]|uniref:Uncharacterized protein n=1 Tax=Aspergillus heteromorphus CBS 117.55 TaxID=1448321 RepID=A0A317WNY6_9EURO|nr:uncharacterized protein BO70DRAFT_393923 [Aspergillus heteromorphus CBS 117.55]PWY88199.1 hypothetical protein BO70DRAFT_393923 [Aspergillus heteromorphus CBS 117.55]
MAQTHQTRAQRMLQARYVQLRDHKSEHISVEEALKMRIEVTGLDLESLSSAFFRPLTSKYFASYPVLAKTKEAIEREEPTMFKVREYNAAAAALVSTSWERMQWSPASCTGDITNTLDNFIWHLPRQNAPEGLGCSLANFSIWSPADTPALVGKARYLNDPPLSDRTSRLDSMFQVEEYTYPHVVMTLKNYTRQPASDGVLLRHELAYIVRAMQLRLEEGYFDQDQPQPVLLLSFMAPQHGRVLEAHIEGSSKILIKCSRLYSFEKNEDAPFELFYRWLLADPVGMTPCEPKPEE